MLIMAFIALIMTAHNSAAAQSRLKIASTEDIAIAFYKTGNIIPNFEQWIKQRDPYINTPFTMREELYEKELARLKLKYISFNPAENLLPINTTVSLDARKKKQADGTEKYYLIAKFKKAPDALYFPYDFLEERIALMPYSLDKFMTLEIPKGDYLHIMRDKLTSGNKMAIFHMRAHEADFTQPYKIDGIEQWVFKTKIAAVEFWNTDKNRFIFEYSKPEYSSQNTIDLQELFKKDQDEIKKSPPIPKGIPKAVPEFIEGK